VPTSLRRDRFQRPCGLGQYRQRRSRKSQVAVQPVASGPADDAAGEQVDDDGKVQPAFAGPDVGDVGAPFLVGPRCREVLDSVRRRREGIREWKGARNGMRLFGL
jgi:hypothetical protein